MVAKPNPEMKKFLPFNMLIDPSSIIELPDEWLYSYPDFLDFDPKIGGLCLTIVLYWGQVLHALQSLPSCSTQASLPTMVGP